MVMRRFSFLDSRNSFSPKTLHKLLLSIKKDKVIYATLVNELNHKISLSIYLFLIIDGSDDNRFVNNMLYNQQMNFDS